MAITIKQARQLSGKTQKEMADLLGVCRHTYMKFEENPDLVPVRYAQKIAFLTGVPVDNIFFSHSSTLSRSDWNES